MIRDRAVVPLASLKPHPRNYRKHPKDQLDHIKESIRRNGVYRNIVVANDGTILAGHGVAEACGELGLQEVPVVRIDAASDSPEAMKVLVGDNEILNLGEIDDRRLTEILKAIKEQDPAGLCGTGYDDMMLASLVYVTRPDGEIKNFNAAAAWVGVPAYDEGSDSIKLVITFTSEKDRKRFCDEKEVKIDKGAIKGTTWSTRWPWTDREDVGAIRFVTAEGKAKGAKK